MSVILFFVSPLFDPYIQEEIFNLLVAYHSLIMSRLTAVTLNASMNNVVELTILGQLTFNLTAYQM